MAKREYREKIKTQLSGNDSRSMWQGLHTISDFKGRQSCAAKMAASLPDELNNCYTRFEVVKTPTIAIINSALVIAKADVHNSFKRFNTAKWLGQTESQAG